METVSIIIPVYNVAPYLRECIDSVVNQTYSNLEIILVDDGSTDESGSICDEYAVRDERITVIHKENAGLSSSRNTGLHLSHGEYVYFLDSDDYLAGNAIEEIVELARAYSADVVYMDAQAFWEEGYVGKQKQSYLRQCDYGVDIGKTAMRRMLESQEFHYAVPLLVFRREFLKANGLAFCEGIIFEDVLFSYQVFQRANQVVHYHKPGYFRRYRAASIMTSRTAIKGFENCYQVYTLLIDAAREYGTLKERETQQYIARIAHNVINYYGRLSLSEKQKHKEMRKQYQRELRAQNYLQDVSLKMKSKSRILWMAYKVLEKGKKFAKGLN